MSEKDDEKFGELLLEDLEEIESEGLNDVTQYEGMKVPIERVSRDMISSKFGPDGKALPDGKEVLAPILRVETAVIATWKTKDNKEIPVRASEIFSLKVKKDEAGKEIVGWSTNEKGALFKLLKKFKKKHPKDLLGVPVMITLRPGKNDQQFLGFVKE